MAGFNARSVDTHSFAMVPRADIPRSTFVMEHGYKTSFDSGLLVPIYCEEVVPGDSFRVDMTGFARLATPIFPIMDNLRLDTFFFFVPNRIVWDNWERFMGAQDSPVSSISYIVPYCQWAGVGVPVGSLFDYFGLPTVGQITGSDTWTHSALPLRGYNLIWNEWFRDENLQNSVTVLRTDGPDPTGNYVLKRRGKRYDYFTSCLPWPLKGGVNVSLPLGTSATVKTAATNLQTTNLNPLIFIDSTSGSTIAGNVSMGIYSGVAGRNATAPAAKVNDITPANLYADLSTATAATINQLRQAFQIQRLLERDARGGTRYVEIIKAHFGVTAPDFRLQRPEYLGGGSSPLQITPIAQTSASGLTGSSTPLANLAAMGTMVARNHGFSRGFTEHGYVIGLASVRADLSYQQGKRRHWDRSTRYDFYFPAFAHLGEQPVLNKEIYCVGTNSQDNLVFGYQERWAEMRFIPSMITGLMRSTSAGTIDVWHLAQRFTSLPVLGDTFIQDTPPLSRVLAVGAGANGQQLLADFFFKTTAARPMPTYSVPGLIDHF